jgi:hypothetical protein
MTPGRLASWDIIMDLLCMRGKGLFSYEWHLKLTSHNLFNFGSYYVETNSPLSDRHFSRVAATTGHGECLVVL